MVSTLEIGIDLMPILRPLFVLAALTIALCLIAGLASAKTYKTVTCASDQYDSGTSCKQSIKVKSSQTKEFRLKCSDAGTKSAKCRPKNGSVSCTVPMVIRNLKHKVSYITCSCTNWDALSNHKVKFTIECGS